MHRTPGLEREELGQREGGSRNLSPGSAGGGLGLHPWVEGKRAGIWISGSERGGPEPRLECEGGRWNLNP